MTTRTEILNNTDRCFIPAAGQNWLLPLYDPMVKLIGGDRIRRRFLAQVRIEPGTRILDIGCGTGTLAFMIQQNQPQAQLIGLDPDPNALKRAERKLAKAGQNAQWDQGYADQLPYSDAEFDFVFSTFMFHHLDAETKEKALRQIRRVLKPGGAVHLLDFKTPDRQERHGPFSRWLHSSHLLEDNSIHRVLEFLTKAEFIDAAMVDEQTMFLWRIASYRAVRPLL